MCDHQSLVGYEEYAFFGRNCLSCLNPGETSPYDAAIKYAAKFQGTCVIEERDGFRIFGPSEISLLSLSQEDEELLERFVSGPALPPLLEHDRKVLTEFLRTPLEDHIKRWKKNIPWRNEDT